VYAVTLLSAQGWARAGSVRVQPVQYCSQQPRITVLRDGKPATGNTVEIYRPVEHPTAAHYQDKVGVTLRTDAKGEVILPKLPQAAVRVVAHWSSRSITMPDLGANLMLRYFPEDPQPEDRFTMELQPSPNEQQYVEETARTAEEKPISERARHFSGSVVDPSGATIPHVSIEVARLWATGTRPVRKLETDTKGHFFALLPAGDYVAIFDEGGFQETVQAVKIDPAAWQTEMRVMLLPGTMTE
jgi:Carboxypeptidase regulatory-like domain